MQNGQTDRTSIVARLQSVVGKERLLLSIKACLPEQLPAHQVRLLLPVAEDRRVSIFNRRLELNSLSADR
jgi:hypothetical protein